MKDLRVLILCLLLTVPAAADNLEHRIDYQIALYDFLGVDSTASAFWTPAKVRRAINNSVRWVQEHSKHYEKKDTIHTVINQIVYQLPTGVSSFNLEAVTRRDPKTYNTITLQRRDIKDFGKIEGLKDVYDVRQDSVLYLYPTSQRVDTLTIHWRTFNGDLAEDTTDVFIYEGHRTIVLDVAEGYTWRMRQQPSIWFQYKEDALKELYGLKSPLPKVVPGKFGLEGDE